MEKIKKLLNTMKEIIMRFPGAVLFLVIFCIFNPVRLVFNSIKLGDKDFLDSCLKMCSYGFNLSFILEILLENLRQKRVRFRLICYSLIAVFIGTLWVSGFFKQDMVAVWGVSTALSCLMLLVFANKDRGSFEFNWIKLFESAFLAFMYSIAAVFAVELLVLAVDGLIGFKAGKLYLDIFWVGTTLVSGFIFLAKIPKIGDQLECPLFIKNIFRYIVIPFVSIAIVIAYVYLIKFYVKIDLSELKILAISLPLTFMVVFTCFFAKIFESRGMEILKKVMLLLLIPIVCLGVGADIMEIKKEALTIENILIAKTYLVLIVFMVLILIKKSKYQHLGLLFAAVLMLISTVGPLKMKNLVLKSQEKRVISVLTRNNMLKDNKFVGVENISQEDYEEIRKAMNELRDYKLAGPEFFESVGMSEKDFSEPWENWKIERKFEKEAKKEASDESADISEKNKRDQEV